MRHQESVQIVDSDGLVVVPAADPGPLSRLVRWAVILIFGILIFGTPIVDLVAPAPPIKLVGTELLHDGRLRRTAKPWDGSLFRLWEHDLRLRSRIRRWATDRYGWVLYRWFGHVQRDLVVGDAGWLFHRDRVESPGDLKTAYLAGRAGASMAALHRRLAALGLESILIPIPRKSSLLAEKLPANVEPRRDVDRAIVDGLLQKGIPTVDLWQALSGEVEEPPYHLLGSHWTNEAQLVTARAVAEATGFVVSPNARTTTVSRSESSSRGIDTDLLAYGGMENRHRLPAEAERRSFTVVSKQSQRPFRERVSQPGRLVVVGSSFSARRRFSGYLSHFIAEPVFNGAQAGRYPGLTLARFLRNGDWKGRTELLVFETPLHHLIFDPVVRLVAPAFATPPPRPILKYFDLESQPLFGAVEAAVDLSKGHGLATIRAGRLAHTGDGVLGVRVRGRTDHELLLQLAPAGGEQVRVPWRPGVNEIVVPLIAANPSAEGVSLAIVRGPAGTQKNTVVIESIDVVSEVRAQPRFDLVISNPASNGDGWRLWMDVPEAVLSPTALLELGLGVQGAFAGDLAVEVQPVGTGAPLRAEWTNLTRGTLVVVSLARFAGQTLERIEVSGSGAAPERLIHRAVLRTGE